MMGAYFGEQEDSIGANQENPHGFWERQDVRQLNDYLLHSLGNDWDKLSGFEFDSLAKEDLAYFCDKAAKIVSKLDSSAPWLLKEPRICVLLDAWKRVLSDPVFIHIYRNPIEVASSLYTRNEISIPEGIALWEKYNIEALNNTIGCKRILVSHGKLLTEPVTQLASIQQQLLGFGDSTLTMPTSEAVLSFVDTRLYRERFDESDLKAYLNQSQYSLFRALESQEAHNELTVRCLSRSASLSLENYHLQRNLLAEARNHLAEARNHRDESLALAEELVSFLDATLASQRWMIGDRLVSTMNKLKGKEKSEAAVIKWLEASKVDLINQKSNLSEK